MRTRMLPLIVAFLAALSACKGADAVKEDLQAYDPIALENLDAAKKLRDKFTFIMQSPKGKSEAEVVAIGVHLADQLLPLLDAHVKAVEAIRPATDPVRALHAKYVDVARAQREAMAAMGQGIEKKDSDVINGAQQKLGAWRKSLDEWETEWKILRKSAGLAPIAP